MAENKKGFVLYADQLAIVQKLVEKDRADGTNNGGELFLHLMLYVNDKNPNPINFIVDMSFEPIKLQLKRDLKVWESKIKQRSDAGKASAESRSTKTNENQRPLKVVESRSTKSTVIDNVTVNVNVKDTVINKYNFVLPEFKESFEIWMEYKKARKESYKSLKSEEMFYNSLVKMSSNSPEISKQIIEQSMANNWAGIFPLKNTSSSSINNSQKSTSKIAGADELGKKVDAKILERLKNNA